MALEKGTTFCTNTATWRLSLIKQTKKITYNFGASKQQKWHSLVFCILLTKKAPSKMAKDTAYSYRLNFISTEAMDRCKAVIYFISNKTLALSGHKPFWFLEHFCESNCDNAIHVLDTLPGI